MESGNLKTREEIDKKYKWKIEDLYKEDSYWEKEYTEIEKGIQKLLKEKGSLGKSAENLLRILKLQDSLSMKMERIYVYANQRLHENTANAYYQSLSGKAQNLMVQLSLACSFIEPELLQIDVERIGQMMEEEPGLLIYQQFIGNILRQKKHILSEEMESLLAGAEEMAESPGTIFSMFHNADIKFPKIKGEQGEEIEITHGRFVPLLESRDREVRKNAFLAVYHTYEGFKNTLAAAFLANVKQDIFFAKARKYESSLAMTLGKSNIPVSVYQNLIEAVEESLPSLHRYMELRKEILGLSELHMYDLYVPLVKEYDVKFSFERAKEIVKKGLEPLGERYAALLEEGFLGGWIDVYENKGKRSGAYSWGAYGTHPYVLLNYQGSLNHVFTLAHEMGHALHSYFSDEAQEFINAGYKIFVAEVASTCNESLLIHSLIQNAESKEEKRYLLNYFLEQFRGTLFRQTMFAEFEKIVHEQEENGQAQTAEGLCELYYGLNQKYFGKNVEIDREIAMEWARIPHFYTSFYVYQYATGFSAAIAISRKILKGDQNVLDGYFRFLRSGSSLYPIDLLKLCGVDMTTKAPVREALELFKELLEEFQKN